MKTTVPTGAGTNQSSPARFKDDNNVSKGSISHNSCDSTSSSTSGSTYTNSNPAATISTTEKNGAVSDKTNAGATNKSGPKTTTMDDSSYDDSTHEATAAAAETTTQEFSINTLPPPRLGAPFLGPPEPPVPAVNFDARAVRQRVRDQEAKIQALLHSNESSPARSMTGIPNNGGGGAGASDGILMKLVKTLENDLKKTEAEKQALQESLDQVKLDQQREKMRQRRERENGQEGGPSQPINKQKDLESDSSFDEYKQASVGTAATAATTATMDSQNDERVKALEMELRQKAFQISMLHERWETTLRRMVQYQCDVETHNVHYTDYTVQMFKEGKDALKEVRGLSKSNNEEKRQLGQKAKVMMSTLLNDLEKLGERYQESRVTQEQHVAELKQEQMEWQHRVWYLENKLEQLQDGTPFDEDEDETLQESTMAGPLMKFHEKLRIQQAAAEQSQAQLQSQLKQSEWECNQATVEKKVHRAENVRLQQTVDKLQKAISEQEERSKIISAKTKSQSSKLKKQQQELKDLRQWAKTIQQQHAQQEAKKMKKASFFKKYRPSPLPPLPEEAAMDDTPLEETDYVIDLEAALKPMDGESQRFDVLLGQLQAQYKAMQDLQDQYRLQARKTTQLEQTVTDLRVAQEKAEAEVESKAVLELRSQLDELERKRKEEKLEAQKTIDDLREKLAIVTKEKLTYAANEKRSTAVAAKAKENASRLAQEAVASSVAHAKPSTAKENASRLAQEAIASSVAHGKPSNAAQAKPSIVKPSFAGQVNLPPPKKDNRPAGLSFI